MTSPITAQPKAPVADDPAVAVPPGYKQTEVGVIPEDWAVTAIGDSNPFVTSGSRGWAKYFSNIGSPFIRITNLSRETIYPDLADLKRVELPSGVSEATRTQIQDGDVLISITADIGIIGYVDARVPKPAYINQHVALVRFASDRVNSRFASYCLAGEHSQRLFRGSTDVGAKAGMSLDTIRKLLLAVPPLLSEQNAIATTLSDVDSLIEALDKLITKKRAIKQATMQQLLTGKTRLPGCEGEWEVKKIGQLLDYERPDTYIVKSADYQENAEIPVLTANKSFVLGFTDEKFGVYRNLPAIIFDDFTTDSKYVDFPFKVKSSAIKILRGKCDDTSLKFVHERMRLIVFPLGDHKRYYISEYRHLQIATPRPEEQAAIATILFDMDAEITALERRRDKTKAIKQGMMQALLTGRVRLVKPRAKA